MLFVYWLPIFTAGVLAIEVTEGLVVDLEFSQEQCDETFTFVSNNVAGNQFTFTKDSFFPDRFISCPPGESGLQHSRSEEEEDSSEYTVYGSYADITGMEQTTDFHVEVWLKFIPQEFVFINLWEFTVNNDFVVYAQLFWSDNRFKIEYFEEQDRFNPLMEQEFENNPLDGNLTHFVFGFHDRNKTYLCFNAECFHGEAATVQSTSWDIDGLGLMYGGVTTTYIYKSIAVYNRPLSQEEN